MNTEYERVEHYDIHYERNDWRVRLEHGEGAVEAHHAEPEWSSDRNLGWALANALYSVHPYLSRPSIVLATMITHLAGDDGMFAYETVPGMQTAIGDLCAAAREIERVYAELDDSTRPAVDEPDELDE